jgi:hypothetical protein
VAKATKKYTSAARPEDPWINALAKLHDENDAKPLVDPLRDYATPMPPGARDMIAELLLPGDPDIIGGRLIYKRTDGIKKSVEWLSLADSYLTLAYQRKRAGKREPAQGAARIVGKKNQQSSETVFRKLRTLRKLAARLRGSE